MTTVDARTLRSIRTHVLKGSLEAAGFERHGSIYVRRDAHQLQGVHFQTNVYGGNFMVNLAFHFDFVPSCFSLDKQKASAFTLLDFCLRQRLGIESDDYHPAYDYPQDAAACEVLFRELGPRILQEVSVYAEQHPDPRAFVELLDPATLQACHAWLESDADHGFDGNADALNRLALWFQEGYAAYLFLGYCALELGDRELARQYAELGTKMHEHYKPSRLKQTRRRTVPVALFGGRPALQIIVAINSREAIIKAMKRLGSV